MSVDRKPYNIEVDYTNTKLKAGLPFTSFMKVVDRKIPLAGKHGRICYKYRMDYQTSEDLACNDVILTDEEKVSFTIPPLTRIDNGSISVEASYFLPIDS